MNTDSAEPASLPAAVYARRLARRWAWFAHALHAQARFEALRAAELLALQRLEAAEARRAAEKERRVAQVGRCF